MAHSHWNQRDVAYPVALALLGSLLPWGLWAWFRFPDIGGPDPGQWEAAALQLTRGVHSLVAPAYPLLIAGLVRLTGVAWDVAGQAIAAGCLGALGPATWLLARRMGASPAMAGIAGLLALLEPWLALSSLQAQPDTLSALAFVLAILAAQEWIARPGWPRLLPLLLVIALVPQVREHAPIIAVGLLVLLAVAPGTKAVRVGRVLLALIFLMAVPTILGETMAWPWQQAWIQSRLGGLLGDITANHAPGFLDGTPPAYVEAFRAAYAGHDRLRIAWLHASLSFYQGWTPWAWVGLGIVGWLLAGRKSWVLVIGLLPLLAVPAGAQQPRHVAVLVPLAAVCWVVGLRRVGSWRRWLVGGVGVGLVAAAWSHPGRAVVEHRGRCWQRLQLRAEAAQLCEVAGSGAVLLRGNPRNLTYCDLPTAEVTAAPRISAALVWVGDLPRERPDLWVSFEPGGFVPVPTGNPDLIVYRRPEKRSSRP